MVERRDERLVFAKQQLTHEAVDRVARVDDRLAPHAVAGVEEHTEADRNARIGELRDVLLGAVLEDLKVVLGEPGDQAALRVGHRDRHLDDVDPRPERLGAHEGHEDGDEPRRTRRLRGPQTGLRWIETGEAA